MFFMCQILGSEINDINNTNCRLSLQTSYTLAGNNTIHTWQIIKKLRGHLGIT